MIIETKVHLNNDTGRIIATVSNLFKKILQSFGNKSVELQFGGELWLLKKSDLSSTSALFAGHITAKAALAFPNDKIITLSYDHGSLFIEPFKEVKKATKHNLMKIKFKKKEDVDFKSIFPTIAEAEYNLIEGMDLILEPASVTKFQKNGFLTLGDHKISKELIFIYESSKQDATQAKVLEKVKKNFIFADDVVDILLTGINLKKNVILYGKGGHGKSEMTELVMKTLYDDQIIDKKPFIQAFGDGLTEDRLLGGMDVQLYHAEGKIKYLLENSFLEHEVVIFEEIFDAPAQVLLTLKDILTSGYYRDGNVQYKCKTKVFIGLTNKSKEEFAEKSDSLKALAERFPLTLKVEWDNYSKGNFIKLFKKVLGDDYYLEHKSKLATLADIINLNNANQTTFVSPRTAVHAATIYCSGKKLEYISDIDKGVLKDYDLKIRNQELDIIQQDFITTIETYIDQNELELINQDKEFFETLNAMNIDHGRPALDMEYLIGDADTRKVKLSKGKFIYNVINRISATPTNVKKLSTLNKKVNHIVNKLQEQIKENPEVSTEKETVKK